MKRIKIMLTAIAVLAVVGGALAFKAQKFSHFNIWTTTATDPEHCAYLLQFSKTTIVAPSVFIPDVTSNTAGGTRTTVALGHCPGVNATVTNVQ